MLFWIFLCVAHISMDSPKLNIRASILCHMEPMMLTFLKISSTGYVTKKILGLSQYFKQMIHYTYNTCKNMNIQLDSYLFFFKDLRLLSYQQRMIPSSWLMNRFWKITPPEPHPDLPQTFSTFYLL
jgi:hypothetical protein